jgi:SagB-type dehydrogenase family enzyme
LNKFNKGKLNSHQIEYSDNFNLVNGSNSKIYQNIISGNIESNTFNYLLNLGSMRISDIKSINEYNYSGLSIEKNSYRYMEEILDEDTITLPSTKTNKGKFQKALTERKSVRDYNPDIVMKIAELSNILKYSVGINKERKISFGETEINTRIHSSGGGLYPVDTYVYINKVQNIANGIYLYQPYSHTLRSISKNCKKQIAISLENNVIDFENCNIIFIFSTALNRSYVKYGELSLLNCIIETGIMAQNIHINSLTNKYNTCDIAGFNKKAIDEILQNDGINSHTLYLISCGKEAEL